MATYESRLRIWTVGVRELKKQRGKWAQLWHPTSLHWFSDRKQCQDHIDTKILKQNFEVYEYKPIRYGPVTRAGQRRR